MGVNQGGVLSGLLFRKYICDLGNYLKREVGVCTDQNTLVHFLWADYLFVISNTVTGLQKQIYRIFKFASENQMGVNKIKTKCMGFGDTKPFKVYFNGCQIDHVVKYKYLGNIIKSTRRVKDDAFGENYKYLCNQARKALFGMYKKPSKIGKKNPSRDNAPHVWCNDQTNPGIR